MKVVSLQTNAFKVGITIILKNQSCFNKMWFYKTSYKIHTIKISCEQVQIKVVITIIIKS
jgi:hypothetical protein